MKKLDLLILRTFIKKFTWTFLVLLVIFLIQYIVTQRLGDLIGKDLEFGLVIELLLYFCIILIPLTLPLAVLFTALISFGTLGEHNELIAMKSAGMSLLRIFRTVVFFVAFLVAFQVVLHDRVVTWASLKGFTLLYNIKIKKPTLNLEENIFYNGLPGYSIKISEKDKVTNMLSDIIIYDHTENKGNNTVIMADKGRMFFDNTGLILRMNLFEGEVFKQMDTEKGEDAFWREAFDSAFFNFSLESFGLGQTDEQSFMGHVQMKQFSQLEVETDSLDTINQNYFKTYAGTIAEIRNIYFEAPANLDSLQAAYGDSLPVLEGFEELFLRSPQDTLKAEGIVLAGLSEGLNTTERVRNVINQYMYTYSTNLRTIISNYIGINRRLAMAFSIFSFFLIASPIALMVKKGGLGLPAIISIILYAIHYIVDITGNKFAVQAIWLPHEGVWFANLIFVFIGLFLLQRAHVDARLFEFRITFVDLKTFSSFLRVGIKSRKQSDN